MRLVHKAVKLVKSGNFLMLLRSVRERVFYKRWRVRLFAARFELENSAAKFPDGFQFDMWLASRPLTSTVESALYMADALDLWSDLDKDDYIYVVWCGERIASFGAIFSRSPQRTVLGLPPNAKLIGGCVTLAEFRGRSLYKLALRESVRLLHQVDASPIFLEVRENNVSSIQGVLGAGFSDLGLVDSSIIFGAFVWREGQIHRIERGVH